MVGGGGRGNGGIHGSGEKLTPQECSSPTTPKFVDICYGVKLEVRSSTRIFFPMYKRGVEERTLLNGVTGVAVPGELLAVLGSSGSGKSTLLRALSGRLPTRCSGSILLNGRALSRSSLRRRIGYVSQDDILYPHLTVWETLMYCALLRLPRSMTRAEKAERADTVVAEMGLEECRDTMVGGAFVRGISGGERRRVSVAMEVVAGEGVVVLDEPTSGLDSTAAMRIVVSMSGMARRGGRTVVAALHQPSSGAFCLFDTVLLLANGRGIYFGPGRDAMDYFAAAGFTPSFPINPADFMLDLANGISHRENQGDAERANVIQCLASSYNELVVSKVMVPMEDTITKDAIQTGSHRSRNEKEPRNYAAAGWFSQFMILLERSLKERYHETFGMHRVIRVVLPAVLVGAMWWQSSINNVQDRLGLFFFISIFWGVFSSSNAVFTFPQERAMLVKERASCMYSLSSYFMARMAGDLPMELILPTVFIIITYWMAVQEHRFLDFLLTLVLLLGYVLVVQGLGLLIGAAIMDAKNASTVLNITTPSFILIGGFYVHHVPAWLAWLKYISFNYYFYRLLIVVHYKGFNSSLISNVEVRRELDTEVSVPVCITMLAVMLVLYRFLAYAALRRMQKKLL